MIFIALLAGALAGVIINYLIPSNYVVDDIIVQGVFYIVGQGFIRLMRMLVVPLVFCSIVCGSMAVGDTKKLGSVGVKTLIFYLCTTALAITVALTIANIFNPGKGLDMSQIQVTSTVSETTQSMSMQVPVRQELSAVNALLYYVTTPTHPKTTSQPSL